MAHRSDRRPGGDRDYDRRDQRGDAPASRRPAPAPLNEYFIDGEGINREVLQIEICKYLGAEATCRPGDYNGRRGFKIRALRPFTPTMLDDLKELSATYESERNLSRRDPRLRGEGSPLQTTNILGDPNYIGAGIPYQESQTLRGRQDPMYSHSPQSQYQQPDLYSPPGSSGYQSTGSSSYQNSQMPYSSTDSGYSTGPYNTMMPNLQSGYSVSSAMSDPRYATANPSYTYATSAANEPYGTYPAAYQPPSDYPPRNDMPGYYPGSSGAEIPGLRAPADPYARDPYGPGYESRVGIPPTTSGGYASSRQGLNPVYDPPSGYQRGPDPRQDPYAQNPRHTGRR